MASFTLTSFNARWGLSVDDEPFDLGAVVAGFDTDVVALQEVWEPSDGTGALAQTADRLGYQLWHVPLAPSFLSPQPEITADPSLAAGTWGVALLSRLPATSTRVVDLGRLVDRWDVAARLAVLADFEVDGRPVTVAAHHLSFALPNALAQLRRLGGWLPAHRPTVVAGDCNLWGPLAHLALRRHRRAVRGRTWPAARPHSQLDHVFVSDGIEVESARILPSAGSDHLPVQATLRLT
jgi:endonuclease/exonuclease/phosphatase family metal-dependent hydrolase